VIAYRSRSSRRPHLTTDRARRCSRQPRRFRPPRRRRAGVVRRRQRGRTAVCDATDSARGGLRHEEWRTTSRRDAVRCAVRFCRRSPRRWRRRCSASRSSATPPHPGRSSDLIDHLPSACAPATSSYRRRRPQVPPSLCSSGPVQHVASACHAPAVDATSTTNPPPRHSGSETDPTPRQPRRRRIRRHQAADRSRNRRTGAGGQARAGRHGGTGTAGRDRRHRKGGPDRNRHKRNGHRPDSTAKGTDTSKGPR